MITKYSALRAASQTIAAWERSQNIADWITRDKTREQAEAYLQNCLQHLSNDLAMAERFQTACPSAGYWINHIRALKKHLRILDTTLDT